mmetsp:Transcript_13077/g.21457  ORF Transcript_13077/g.21457 Transcript_13077/m.21457 type:complete len:228 (+) Transcript_13077:1183-1866(+)
MPPQPPGRETRSKDNSTRLVDSRGEDQQQNLRTQSDANESKTRSALPRTYGKGSSKDRNKKATTSTIALSDSESEKVPQSPGPIERTDSEIYAVSPLPAIPRHRAQNGRNKDMDGAIGFKPDEARIGHVTCIPHSSIRFRENEFVVKEDSPSGAAHHDIFKYADVETIKIRKDPLPGAGAQLPCRFIAFEIMNDQKYEKKQFDVYSLDKSKKSVVCVWHTQARRWTR